MCIIPDPVYYEKLINKLYLFCFIWFSLDLTELLLKIKSFFFPFILFFFNLTQWNNTDKSINFERIKRLPQLYGLDCTTYVCNFILFLMLEFMLKWK